MRRFLIASVVTGIASSAVAHATANGARQRKSLGFGPIHPHAEYVSNPYQIKTNAFLPDPEACPHMTAKRFVDDVLGSKLSESYGYKIREDSYTDKATGISHIYVRQIVNGIEVTDGDMNINVKDGMVLSYGNSFYPGLPPAPFTVPDSETFIHSHVEFCQQLISPFVIQNGNQVNLAKPPSPIDAASTIELMKSNCQHQYLPQEMAELYPHTDYADPRPALLQFMVAATPNEKLGLDIKSNYNTHLDKMSVMMGGPLNLFAPTDSQPVAFVDNVPDTVNPVKAKLVYNQVPSVDGKSTVLHLAWKFEVEMQDNWYETSVSALPPHKILSVVDWASDAPIPTPPSEETKATYNVFVWGVNDPSESNRTMEKENFDALASPVGWHAIPYANDPSFAGMRGKPKDFWRNTTTTWGNNVFAQENWEGQNSYIDNYRPDAGESKVFDFPYNPAQTNASDALDEAKKYINATITQLFYTSNMVHDIFYRYGFDEVSGNFQAYNFERGGQENDAVIANAQDGSGYNNANFMTPPDGQNGRMRMYLWNTANPYRDGDLEAGIVIHELAHGLSTRLTGGPANSGCLGFGESGGMGEGWGDFLATTIRSTKTYSDYPMGAWAANRGNGIRNYPYSLNDTINPSLYKTLDKPGYWGVHAIGEVWAEMLWITSQRLIKVHGFSDNLYPPQPLENGTVPEGDFYRPAAGKKPLIPKHGNSLMVQLVLNGMKLQPCRPSFFDARDAIILADQQLTGGENFCTLWNGFSERGLGVDATVQGRTPWGGGIRTNGYQVPVACQGTA